MRWLSVLSEEADGLAAAADAARRAREAASVPPDLVFLFPSARHRDHYAALGAVVARELRPKHLIGCSGGGVIGGGAEVEHRPGLSLLCAWLPGVDVRTFHLTVEDLPTPDDGPRKWRAALGLAPDAAPAAVIVLADPFTFDPDHLNQGLDFALPSSVVLGGLASGARAPGGNILFLDAEAFGGGAVGVALSGALEVDPIVAQGCRPVGPELQVTACDKNVILELDGRRPLDALRDLLDALDPGDRELARHAMFLGIRGSSMRSGPGAEGYLVRNLIALDPERGVLAVGAMMRPGRSVRFHVRDRESASRDLAATLAGYARERRGAEPKGALLFSCLGRGVHLFGEPGHDSAMFRDAVADVPLGGFFCNGEIGPVDGQTYLHGFTSCFGVFRAKE